MLQTKSLVHILALFNHYIMIFTIFYIANDNKSQSKHLHIALG